MLRRRPASALPFTLQWNPSRAHTAAVARFVHAVLTRELPDGWRTLPDHLRHRGERSVPAGKRDAWVTRREWPG